MSHPAVLSVARLKPKRALIRSRDFAGLPFEQLSAALHRYLRRRARNSAYAEDLEQEVYLRLLRVADEELVRCPKAYVYRIASNLLSQRALQEQQSRVDFDSEAVAALAERKSDESPPPDELYDREDNEQRLAKVVSQLPPMQKAVFVLARYQGLSHAEIAEQFGISVHTVKKHMLRAICHCREALAETRDEKGIDR